MFLSLYSVAKPAGDGSFMMTVDSGADVPVVGVRSLPDCLMRRINKGAAVECETMGGRVSTLGTIDATLLICKDVMPGNVTLPVVFHVVQDRNEVLIPIDYFDSVQTSRQNGMMDLSSGLTKSIATT